MQFFCSYAGGFIRRQKIPDSACSQCPGFGCYGIISGLSYSLFNDDVRVCVTDPLLEVGDSLIPGLCTVRIFAYLLKPEGINGIVVISALFSTAFQISSYPDMMPYPLALRSSAASKNFSQPGPILL